MNENTDCAQISIWLVDFADGNLDKETYVKVHEHLEHCEVCSQNLQEIKTLLDEIGAVENEIAPASMKEKFHQMLNSEIRKTGIRFKEQDEVSPGVIKILPKINKSFWFQIAAAVILLVSGALVDRLVLSTRRQNNTPAYSSFNQDGEKYTINKLFPGNILNERSPSARIRVIDSIQVLKEPGQEIIEVLFSVLNTDKNVNVRYSAAQALAQYNQNEKIRTDLIESLTIQDDPLIQITLINLLVHSGEIRAGDAMKQLIYNPETQETVREEAQKGLNILKL